MFSSTSWQICDPSLLPPMAMMKIRDFIMQHSLKKVPDIVAMGQHVLEQEQRWKEVEVLHNCLKKKSSKDKWDRRLRNNSAKNLLSSLK